MKSLLTIKEVGEILQVNERTILRLIKAQKIPAVKIGNQWRFHPARLEAWFMNGGEDTLVENETQENRWKEEEEFRLFSKNRSLLDIHCRTKQETLETMVDVLTETGHLLQREVFLQAVLERERISTTGIGNGVALPHAWHPINDLFRVPLVVSARLSTPIEFDAVDNKPVDLVFLLCSPRNRQHLALLSTMSVIGRNTEILHDLRRAKTVGDFTAILAGASPVAIGQR